MIGRLNAHHAALLHALEAVACSGMSPQQLNEALADEDTVVLGAWQEEELVGYALVAKLPFDAELQAIGVLPACQGQGIGQRLLHDVVMAATQWQAERLLLEVRASNQRAIRLYRQAGFGEDGCRKGYYPAAKGTTGREDALLMSRPLA